MPEGYNFRQIIGGTEASKRMAQDAREQAEANRKYRAEFRVERFRRFIEERPYLNFRGGMVGDSDDDSGNDGGVCNCGCEYCCSRPEQDQEKGDQK